MGKHGKTWENMGKWKTAVIKLACLSFFCFFLKATILAHMAWVWQPGIQSLQLHHAAYLGTFDPPFKKHHELKS